MALPNLNPLDEVREVHQTTATTYLAEYHNGHRFYYLPEDALCPYLTIARQDVEQAPEPFFVYNILPKCGVGVPMTYGSNVIVEPRKWSDEQKNEFGALSAKFEGLQFLTSVGRIKELNVPTVTYWGGEHFKRFHLVAEDVEAFIKWGTPYRFLLLQVATKSGEHVLTDFSVVMPTETCGIFCHWNADFKLLRPGIFACVKVAEEAERLGFGKYNLGLEYLYKKPLATSYEPAFGVAKCPLDHPFLADAESPASWFGKDQINVFTSSTTVTAP